MTFVGEGHRVKIGRKFSIGQLPLSKSKGERTADIEVLKPEIFIC